MLRILASVLLFISVLFGPFWLSVLLGLVGMIYFPMYFEAVALFLISDLLYGVKEPMLWGMTYLGFLGSFIIEIIIEFTKQKIRFNK